MEELRRELGETRFAKERLEVESRSVREISDKRKKALDDALSKLQEKKLQVEKQAEELNKRAEDIDAVSLFRHQVAELQECNRQLDGELSILRRDHKATVNELAYMKDEVDQLQKELEQKEVEERETNSLISQIKEQLASALQTVCNQDTDILGLKEDLIVSQAQLEELIAAAGSSENIASELLDKLQLSEDKTTILEKQVVRLRVALEGAEGSLKEETVEILSLCDSFDELQSLLANIKLDAKSALREGMHYAAEFRTAMKGFQNVKVQLEIFQKRENDMTSKLVRLEELLKDGQSTSTMQAKQIGLLDNTVKDLDSQLSEWKNKAATAVEDAEYTRSQLQNANQVIHDLQEQFDGWNSTQEGSKEISDSTLSPAYIDGLKTDLKNWKAMAMSITEEMTEVRLQLKHSEENAIEQNSKIEAYKNKEHLMEKQYSTLQEEICNCFSGLSSEMDKFLLVCHSMEELERDALKSKEEVLLNHRQLRDAISAFRGELAVFEIFKGQAQSFEVKLQTVQEQLLIWKDKVAVADAQNKSLKTDLEIANISLDELRKYKEEAMEREKRLQVELSATQESLQNLNHNLLEETGRVNSLLSSIKSMEDEINNLLEKIRSGNEEEKSIELELETPKTCFLQKALCQLQNLQVVDDVNLRARFQSIQDRKLNWATEGALDV
jgi:chromosome segregation ATPase